MPTPTIEHYPSDLDFDRLLFAIEKGECQFDSKVFERALAFLFAADIVDLFTSGEVTEVMAYRKPPTISFLYPFRAFRDQAIEAGMTPLDWEYFLHDLWGAAGVVSKRILTMERRVMQTGEARGTTDATDAH